MEFRIAPMILSVLLFLYLLFINPFINEGISLKMAADYSKTLIPMALLLILSWSTFFRHSYYSLPFKISYWTIQVINISLVVFYFYFIQQQHL